MKDKKSIMLLVIALLFVILGLVLIFKFHLIGYALLAFSFFVVIFMTGIDSMMKSGNPDKQYESNIKDILNTFDSILVKSSTPPELEGRNVIVVSSIEDLVDAQLEIRKPICYIKQTESCSFILLDEKEAYAYIEKMNDDVVSPLEIAIQESKIKHRSKDEMDAEMLRDIEKTTVVKLSNKKSYKVSPIRKKEQEQQTVEQQATVQQQAPVVPGPIVEPKTFTPAIEELDDPFMNQSLEQSFVPAKALGEIETLDDEFSQTMNLGKIDPNPEKEKTELLDEVEML